MITIKRYSNRKLYNTKSHSYVSLDDIGTMVKEDVSFKVVDNSSGDDITSKTLKAVAFHVSEGSDKEWIELIKR